MDELSTEDRWVTGVVRERLEADGYKVEAGNGLRNGEPELVVETEAVAVMSRKCLPYGHELHPGQPCHLANIGSKAFGEQIDKNRKAAAEIEERLRAQGWRVLVVWQCSMKGKTSVSRDVVLDAVSAFMRGSEARREISGKGRKEA